MREGVRREGFTTQMVKRLNSTSIVVISVVWGQTLEEDNKRNAVICQTDIARINYKANGIKKRFNHSVAEWKDIKTPCGRV